MNDVVNSNSVIQKMKIVFILIASFFISSSRAAIADSIISKPWNNLGYFDGEQADLERICEHNINQLEDVESAYAKITAIFDIPYKRNRDSSVRIYDIKKDNDRTTITSNSISIGEKDMGTFEVLDDYLSNYLGDKNILIIKAHGYGIIPGFAKIAYNTPLDPVVISNVLQKRLNKPLDVLIFDSCNMASVEVAYEFKNLVSVMVASQDLMYYLYDATEKNTLSSRPGIDYYGLVLKLKPNSKPITIGKDMVNGFMEIVSKQDAIYNKATISAIDLDLLDTAIFKRHAENLLKGLENPKTRKKYLSALKIALDEANYCKPLGRLMVVTYYEISDFFKILGSRLNEPFELPKTGVIQSFSNNHISSATGLSVLFFRDLSTIPPERKERLLRQYARSKFARATGWDHLIRTYYNYLESDGFL